MPPDVPDTHPDHPAAPARVAFPGRADRGFWRWLVPTAIAIPAVLVAGPARSTASEPATWAEAVVISLLVVVPIGLLLLRLARRPADHLDGGDLVVGGRRPRRIPLATSLQVEVAAVVDGASLRVTDEDGETHELRLVVDHDGDLDALDREDLRVLAEALRRADVDGTIGDRSWDSAMVPRVGFAVRGGPRTDLLAARRRLLDQAEHLDRPGRRPETGPLLRPAGATDEGA